ncbi:MAG TPA: CRISPR-associated protein Cas4 [Tissierellaceae bacterium]|nr:CRISPR-associated protein Cas4 [Tissierellaceae bacterium]
MKKITGVMVYYYFVCKKRLWYFANGINMEQESELVTMGKLIDEHSYSREKKHIMIDEKINIDFLKGWDIIHEIKKSDKLEEASILQIRYYIYVLKKKGLVIEKGILDYPQLRKRKEVYLDNENEIEMERILEGIRGIIELKVPTKNIKIAYCNKCSYYELCFI